jgi:predicted transposase YdaD
MAGSFDNVMKRLIGEYGQQFTQWLDSEAAFIQALNIELKSQHIYADALLQVDKRKKPGILHLEVQTEKDPDMEVRLLEYNILASRQYNHLPVYSHVMYLRDVSDVPEPPYIRRFPDDEGEEVFRFYYKSIKLADIPAEVILESGLIGLLPFVTLTKGGKELRLTSNGKSTRWFSLRGRKRARSIQKEVPHVSECVTRFVGVSGDS